MKKILIALGVFFAASSAIANTTTPHYALNKPTNGGDSNIWGPLLNSNFASLDSLVWSASGGMTVAVNAPSSATTITLTNPIDNAQNVTLTAPSQALVLPPMNATSSPVAGGIIYINNIGSNTFKIFANDGSTVILNSLIAGQSVELQVSSNATSNGTFNIYGPYQTASSSVNLGSSVTATSPQISDDSTSGFYTAAPAEVNVAISGSQVMQWDATGINIPGLTASELVGTTSGKYLTNLTALPNGTTATTQSVSDNSTKIATTAYVDGTFAPLANAALIGTPTSPTAAIGTSTTQVATTAFSNPTSTCSSVPNQCFELPSGIIIEQGQFISSSGGFTTLSFPVPFPNGPLSVTGSVLSSTADLRTPLFTYSMATKTGIPAAVAGPSNGTFATSTIAYIAIGD